MNIMEARRSFASWVDQRGDTVFGSDNRRKLKEIFDQCVTEAGVDDELFQKSLSEMQVSPHAVVTIRKVAHDCLRHPKMYHFFEETDPKSPAAKHFLTKWEDKEEPSFARIQRAFSNACKDTGRIDDVLEAIATETHQDHISFQTATSLAMAAWEYYNVIE